MPAIWKNIAMALRRQSALGDRGCAQHRLWLRRSLALAVGLAPLTVASAAAGGPLQSSGGRGTTAVPTVIIMGNSAADGARQWTAGVGGTVLPLGLGWANQIPATNRQPNCGKGVRDRKVAATYRAKRFKRGGYRTDTMYCGNSKYGYRHLKIHIGQYFGGWGTFDFSIAQVLKKPQVQFEQKNGTLFTEAPIIQCFPLQNYYILWSFFVIPTVRDGSIITALGRNKGRTPGPCP